MSSTPCPSVPAQAIFRSENVARLLADSGFPEEQIATVTFAYEHTSSMDDALGAADHATTFLRPVIKVQRQRRRPRQ